MSFSFGSSFSQPSTASNLFSFGSSNTGSGFGGNTGFSSFGQTQQQQSSPFNFGSSSFAFPSTTQSPNNNPFSFTSFGQPQQQQQQQQQRQQQPGFDFANFGQTTQQQQAQQLQQQQFQQLQQQQQELAAIEKRILEIKAAYDPSNQNSKFQTYFYNKIDPSRPINYVAPSNASTAVWTKAVASNPSPSTLTPTLAIGFSDLKKRLLEQSKARSVLIDSTNEVKSTVESMTHAYEAGARIRMEVIRETQISLSHRLLTLLSRIERHRARDIPILKEEEEYRKRLEEMARQLQTPAQYGNALRECMSRVRAIEAANNEGNIIGGGGREGDEILGDLTIESLEQLQRFLTTQTAALEYLTTVVKEDRSVINVIAKEGGNIAVVT